jgi:Uma2 family endonuclease
VARGCESIIAADGIRGGAPDAVIEIRSPDDETDEKLPFFAALGVAEVIVIDPA